jgi:hypothetical protein
MLLYILTHGICMKYDMYSLHLKITFHYHYMNYFTASIYRNPRKIILHSPSQISNQF